MDGPIEFLILLAFGLGCAGLANSRGRNPVGWFLLGFFFNCFALVMLFVLPDEKESEERDKRHRTTQRRLREELAQERQKNQQFRGHVKARLDVHDAALGVDTREQSVAELPAPAPPTPPPAPSLAELPADVPLDGWYVAEAGSDADGPLSMEDLRARAAEGRLRPRTLIWNADYQSEWQAISETPLSEHLT